MTARPSIVRGALFTIAMRWTDRLIGFVSTLILARLLLADDFGIIAMASLVVGLVDTLIDLGTHVALIQRRELTRGHYDTAWTIRLAQASVSAALLALAAPLAADYFGDPRVVPVIWGLAAALFVAGWENIGTVDFQRDMAFDRDFRLTVTKRLIGFAVTMALALWWRNYWAMVAGTIAFRLAGVVLSYAMHPHRPRFDLSQRRDILGVSQWIIARSFAVYLNTALHRLTVGRIAPAATLGGYQLADEISSMPSSELLSPINRVLLPAFARAPDDAERVRLFLLAQGVQTLLGLPAGVGLALIAADAVPWLLGPNWAFTIPFVQLLSITNALLAVHYAGAYALLAKGAFRSATLLNWSQVLAFGAGLGIAWSVTALTPITVAWVHLGVALFGLWATLALVRRALPPLRWRAIAGAVWRPVVAAAAMAAVCLALPLGPLAGIVRLLILVLTGVATYAAGLVLLWVIAGRPAGPERWALDAAAPIGRRFAPRVHAWLARS